MAKAKPDPLLEEETKALVEGLNRELVSLGKSFSLAMPYKATVLMKSPPDYRKLIVTDQEFFFKEVKAGRRERLIFVFEPVDNQPFSQIEFTEREIAEGKVRGFETAMTEKLGCDLDAHKRLVHSNFEAAQEEARKEADDEKAKSTADRYADRPNWGMF